MDSVSMLKKGKNHKSKLEGARGFKKMAFDDETHEKDTAKYKPIKVSSVEEKYKRLGVSGSKMIFTDNEKKKEKPTISGFELNGLVMGDYQKPNKDYISEREIIRAQMNNLLQQQFGTDKVTNYHLNTIKQKQTKIDPSNAEIFNKIKERERTKLSFVPEEGEEEEEEEEENEKEVTDLLVKVIDEADNRHAHREDSEYYPVSVVKDDYDHEKEKSNFNWDF